MLEKKYYKSKFNGCVRIRKNQLEWLNKNKKRYNCKTTAGFLDILINNQKEHDEKL